MVSIISWFNDVQIDITGLNVMSRKHFILLAAALRVARMHVDNADSTALWVVDELIYTIATVCDSVNPNFSYDRFYTASNYKGRDND